MQYAIVTGDSRGLGEAIAQQFIEKNVNIIGVSRNENNELQSLAEQMGVTYTHVHCDLSKPEQLEEAFEEIVHEAFDQKETHHVYLVNNAGIIEPIETVGQFHSEDVMKHIQINITVPMLMINRCLKEVNQRDIPASIINITSGAAERSVHGWSTYSSSKAAINRFTETVALEQNDRDHIILAFSPGLIDTDMQGEIRSSSKTSFADVDKFKQFKEEGALRPPKEVASVLMNLLNDPNSIVSGNNYKLYDLIE